MGNYDLTVCDCGHEQVCFLGRTCPLCKEVQKVEELLKEIELLKEELQKENR